MIHIKLTTNQILVLSVLLKERTGREITRAIKEHRSIEVPYSTVYSALGSLEARQLIKSVDAKKGQDGRLRHFKVTARGRTALQQQPLGLSASSKGRLRPI